MWTPDSARPARRRRPPPASLRLHAFALSTVCLVAACDDACERDADCDDGIPCTVDVCDPDVGCARIADPSLCGEDGDCATFRCDPLEGCRETREEDGIACDDDRDLCTTGVCDEGVCAETAIDCADDVACTDDVCEAGVCTDNVPDDTRCDDADPCTADACDAEIGCSHTPLPDFTPCDDGDAATGPDLCRASVCVGAVQGEITGIRSLTVAGAAMGSDRAFLALNDDAGTALYEVIDAGEHRSLGSTPGVARRVRVLGGTTVVVGERAGDTSGGLNCTYGDRGPCPLLGFYPGEGPVRWNGTPVHDSLDGFGIASLHDVARFTDAEPTACETPPCYDELQWWFVGSRQGASLRPSAHTCRERSPTVVACSSIGDAYASAGFDGGAFVSVDVGATRDLFDPEYLYGAFGLRLPGAASVLTDTDAVPGDALGSVRQAIGSATLRGSVRRACDSLLFYGDGGAGLCESGDTAVFGCQSDNVWGCRSILADGDYVAGMRAGPTVLVQARSLLVHQSGDVSDPANWTEVPVDLPDGVRLAGIAGTSGRWLLFAEDPGANAVRIHELVW